MSLGTYRDQTSIPQGDSAELEAYIFDQNDNPPAAADLASVQYTIQRPDDSVVSLPGTIQPDGGGFLRYLNTNLLGTYVWKAKFVYNSGRVRSKADEFVVIDPFAPTVQTWNQQIAEQVWMRFEDAFDSEEGGPWLQDMTLKYYFNPEKIERFIAEGILEINITPPSTNITADYFVKYQEDFDPNTPVGTQMSDPDQSVLVKATQLAVMKHLMRSYVEQPAPQGANIVFQDRRDYLQRWQSLYTLEEAELRRTVTLWKRQFLNLGRSSMILGQKAGRLGYGSSYRTRNVGRGYGY